MSALTAVVIADGPLARRNPTVKLILLGLVSLAAIFLLDPITPAVLYLGGLVGVIASVRVAPRTLLLVQLPFFGFALGLFIVNMLSRPGTVLWQAGILRITEEGLSIGTALAARTLLIGVLAAGFLLSTDGVALMTSLHQNARLNARVTYAILAGYRMLQQIPREWTTIRQAQAIRSNTRNGARLPRTPQHLSRVIFTLLIVSIRKGERIAQALESRGLGLEPRTTWKQIRVTGTDWALAAGVLIIVAMVITSTATLGILEGPSALFG